MNEVLFFTAHRDDIYSIQFSPNGQQIWNMEMGALESDLKFGIFIH